MSNLTLAALLMIVAMKLHNIKDKTPEFEALALIMMTILVAIFIKNEDR